jgi:hypothetical protein
MEERKKNIVKERNERREMKEKRRNKEDEYTYSVID